MTDSIKIRNCADSIYFIAALKERGADARITIMEDYAHFDVPQAYLDPTLNLMEWLLLDDDTSKIPAINVSENTTTKAFRLDGTLAKADAKGIVIQDGKKL